MPEFSLARTFRNRGLLLQTGSQFSNSAYVKVDVYFTAVGMIDILTEQEILAMKEEMQKNPQQFRFIA